MAEKVTCAIGNWCCILLSLSFFWGGSLDSAAGEPASEAAVRSGVERYVKGKKAAYAAETERLRRLLGLLGMEVKTPAPVLQLPEPHEILVTVTREGGDDVRTPPVPLGAQDFLGGISLFRPPQPKDWPGLSILDAPQRSGPARRAFDKEWKCGSVYAADDQTARVLGLPRSIPIGATGVVLRYKKIIGTLYWAAPGARKATPIARVPCARIILSPDVPLVKGSSIQDLTGMIVAGKSPGKIELDLQGTNLAYRPDGHRLVPRAAGPIHMPAARIYVQEWKKIVLLAAGAKESSGLIGAETDGNSVWVKYQEPAFYVTIPRIFIYYPAKAAGKVSYDGTYTRISSTRIEIGIPFRHWRQKPKSSSGYVVSWLGRPKSGPYDSVRENEPTKAVSLEGVELGVSLQEGIYEAGENDTDFFFPAEQTQFATAFVRYCALVSDGKTIVRMNLPNPHFEYTSGPFEVSQHTVRPLGTPGEVTLTYSLPDGGGFRRSHRFTTNIAELRMDCPSVSIPGYPRTVRILAVGQSMKVQALVRGPADMSAYRVKWDNTSNWNVPRKRSMTNRDMKLEFSESTSRFVRHGEVWIAETDVTLPLETVRESLERLLSKGSTAPFHAIRTTASFSIQGELTGPGLAFPLTVSSEYVQLSSPPLTRITLEGTRTAPGGKQSPRTDGGPFDLFLTDGDTGIIPVVDLQYGTGQGALVVSNITRLPRWLRVQQDKEHLLSKKQNGRITISQKRPRTGTARIRAVVLKGAARVALVALPEDKGSVVSNDLEITVNRIRLLYFDIPGAPEWTVLVDGPADMSSYTTHWNTWGGNVPDQRFKRGSWTSSATLDHGQRLRSVDILDAFGQVVAHLTADNTPTVGTQVAVQGPPDHFTQGSYQKVTAIVRGLPLQWALHTLCDWSVSPASMQPRLVKTKTPLGLAPNSKPGDAEYDFSTSTYVRFPEREAETGKYATIKAVPRFSLSGQALGSGSLTQLLMPSRQAMADLSNNKKEELTDRIAAQEQYVPGAVDVQVLDVRNVNGNNPLNSIQPVNNVDNRTFNTLDQTLTAQKGGGGGGGALPGFPQTAHNIENLGGQWYASMNINPVANTATVLGNSNGEAVFVQIPPFPASVGGDGSVSAVGFFGWEMVPPGTVSLQNNVPKIITVRNGAATYKITLTIIPHGTDYDLRVDSVIRL